MKILIIGGTSSVGLALKPVLSEFGEVLTAGRRDCDIQLDLNDPAGKVSFPDGLDAVIHTAAHFGGKGAEDILEAEYVNVLGTLKLCREAVRSKAGHFVLISSMFTCLHENSPFFGIYALSKRHSEETAGYYCSVHPLLLSVLRPSQIYGNEERFRRHQPFFYQMIDGAEKGEDILLYGSHDPQRNYIHIDDLTAVIARVVKDRVEGTYACAHPQDSSYARIAGAAQRAFGKGGTVRYLRDKDDIPDNIFEKDDTLYRKIGFYPQVSVEEGIAGIVSFRRGSL